MARAAVSASLKHFSLKSSPQSLSSRIPATFSFSTFHTPSKKKNHELRRPKPKKTTSSSSSSSAIAAASNLKSKSAALEVVKRRTRSEKEFDVDYVKRYGDEDSHIPVMLGEVLDVFDSSLSSFRLNSFVDCTLGAAGHSCAMIQAHPELQTYIGLDVDPVAHEKAQSRINYVLKSKPACSNIDLKTHMLLRNFKEIRQAIGEVEDKLLVSGVDGILMDLGMSSMQVDDPRRGFSMLNDGPLDMRMDPKGSLKAEDILNSWPPTELGRILKEYGEESNWYSLQNKIVKARLEGGFHTTSDLVDLIRGTTSRVKGTSRMILLEQNVHCKAKLFSNGMTFSITSRENISLSQWAKFSGIKAVTAFTLRFVLSSLPRRYFLKVLIYFVVVVSMIYHLI